MIQLQTIHGKNWCPKTKFFRDYILWALAIAWILTVQLKQRDLGMNKVNLSYSQFCPQDHTEESREREKTTRRARDWWLSNFFVNSIKHDISSQYFFTRFLTIWNSDILFFKTKLSILCLLDRVDKLRLHLLLFQSILSSLFSGSAGKERKRYPAERWEKRARRISSCAQLV